MSMLPPYHRRIVTVGLCVFALVGLWAPARSAVNVGLTPATQVVTPGSDFDVFIDITVAGSAFNGFDAVVSYDPAALTFLPTSPTSLQQGCLMTGGCSAACGSTFHRFSAAGDSLSVNNVLLCNQVSLTGPGHLYKLRFRASNTPQATSLTIRRTQFVNAGLFVTPVNASGCLVGIGVSVGVGTPQSAVARPLRVEPNPAYGPVSFIAEDDAAGLAEADILDLQGRIVQHIGPTWFGPRARLGWDGRDAAGMRVPAGLYLVRIQRGGQVQSARVILLQ